MKGEKSHYRLKPSLYPLKEEWKLLAGSPTTARKFPELDVGKSSDNYDSSMFPKLILTTDGQPLPLRDKAKTLHENGLLPLQELSSSVDNVDHNSEKVIFIDWSMVCTKIKI